MRMCCVRLFIVSCTKHSRHSFSFDSIALILDGQCWRQCSFNKMHFKKIVTSIVCVRVSVCVLAIQAYHSHQSTSFLFIFSFWKNVKPMATKNRHKICHEHKTVTNHSLYIISFHKHSKYIDTCRHCIARLYIIYCQWTWLSNAFTDEEYISGRRGQERWDGTRWNETLGITINIFFLYDCILKDCERGKLCGIIECSFDASI